MKVLFAYRGAESIGVEYLSAVLKEGGHSTDLFFDYAFFDDSNVHYPKLNRLFDWVLSFKEKIRSYEPDIVALSATTNLYPWVKAAAAAAKEFSLPTVIGGVHATAAPEIVIQNDLFDFVCVGEGDYALLELINSIEANKDCSKINNIWSKKDGVVYKNQIRDLIDDLDKLPFPDKDIFYKYNCLNKKNYVIFTGRGCPFKCTFCFNHFYVKLYSGKGKYVRARSAENIVEELKMAKEKYKINFVDFRDDTFTLNKNWVLKFLSLYKQEIDLPFSCLVHANTVDALLASELKKAGCAQVEMGIESGNENLRNSLLKKGVSNEKFFQTIKILKNANIVIRGDIIFGVPEETNEQMWDSIKFLKEIKIDHISSGIFYPFPKTELADYASSIGLVNVKEILEGSGSGIRENTVLKMSNEKTVKRFATLAAFVNYLPLFILKIFIKWNFISKSALHLGMVGFIYINKLSYGRSSGRGALYFKALMLIIKKYATFDKDRIKFPMP